MPRVYLGVGSNIERERYITAGLDALQGLFGELTLSPVYDSVAIGFDGQPFLNLVAGVDTNLGVGELARYVVEEAAACCERRRAMLFSGISANKRCSRPSRSTPI